MRWPAVDASSNIGGRTRIGTSKTRVVAIGRKKKNLRLVMARLGFEICLPEIENAEDEEGERAADRDC